MVFVIIFEYNEIWRILCVPFDSQLLAVVPSPLISLPFLAYFNFSSPNHHQFYFLKTPEICPSDPTKTIGAERDGEKDVSHANELVCDDDFLS